MVNTKRSRSSSNQENGNMDIVTRMRSSMKRPRAPIACIRCHHKKIRCDGEHPNCARCTQGGILCAYPGSRRSRNTPPAIMDPFIDNLSQLEIKIHQIEANLRSQRSLFLSFAAANANGNLTMMTNSSNHEINEIKSKHIKIPSFHETHPSHLANGQLKNYPQMKSSSKRSSPATHSHGRSGNKRPKRSITTTPTPKIKTLSSPSTFPLSPLSTSSSLSKSTIPFSNNEDLGYSPSSLSHNYSFSTLDTTFSFQTDWAHASPSNANNSMSTHVLYSGQQRQTHPSIYYAHPQCPLFLSQQVSPVTTPGYTDDSISDQFNLTTSTPPASVHTATNTHNHHHYLLSSSAYSSHTLPSLSITSPPSAHSSSADSLSHTFTTSPPISQQITSCQMIDLYNNLTMDDLISFDSQNTGMPLIDNTVWYC